MQILVHMSKELLLLRRDRAGLCMLFLMPVLLVLILSLIQDNLFRANGQMAVQVLFVNLDMGPFGQKLADTIAQHGALELVSDIEGERITAEDAKKIVAQGDFHFAVIVPREFSKEIDRSIQNARKGAWKKPENGQILQTEGVLSILFDPAVRGIYRTGVFNGLRLAVAGLEMQIKTHLFAQILKGELKDLPGNVGMPVERRFQQTSATPGEDEASWQPFVAVREVQSRPDPFTRLPSSVQQNVPAWSLFGMFFIVIPLSGTLLRERQEGTLQRLMSMPTSGISLLLGKVFAYLVVCLVQFVLMLMVGLFILPMLGTPVLDLGNSPAALFFAALSSGLAACGFGILAGVLAKSYTQVSVLGSILVVLMAALGGIMVPVYVMPQIMQKLSVISPLGWGLSAFLDIFVRDGSLSTIAPYLCRLLLFFIVCTGLSALCWRRSAGLE